MVAGTFYKHVIKADVDINIVKGGVHGISRRVTVV